MRGFITVMLVWAGAAHADQCRPGGTVEYPLAEILRYEAIGYSVDNTRSATSEGIEIGFDYATGYPPILAKRSAALPPALADLPYLVLLGGQLDYPNPMDTLTYMPESIVLPQIVVALERQGLTEAADAARVPLSIYPDDWEAALSSRQEDISADGSPWSGGPHGETLMAASEVLHRLTPEIRAATLALIASDPAVAAQYEALRQEAGTDLQITYLMNVLWFDCLGDWWTPDEADAAFADMGKTQSDLLILHEFLTESHHDSTYQYFYNPSGTMAPQLADLLDRLGLPDHAAGIRQGMAVFPTPYPRDTDARRAVMAGFTEAQDEALYALTGWADDGLIWELMARVANDAGLMPR